MVTPHTTSSWSLLTKFVGPGMYSLSNATESENPINIIGKKLN